MALAVNTPREHVLGPWTRLGKQPVKANAIIFEGGAQMLTAGYAEPLSGSGKIFAGFALRKVDATGLNSGDVSVDLVVEGSVPLTVAGITALSDVNSDVYASADGTFSLSSIGGTKIGKIEKVLSVADTTAMVRYRAAADNGAVSVRVIQQTFTVADFTDDAGTSGHLDLATQLPANSLVLGWKFVTSGGFSGDTTAVMKAGTSGTLDKFSANTTGSVLAAGTIGTQPKSSDNPFVSAATTVRITVTGAADFTAIQTAAVGAGTFYIYYLPLL